MMMTEKAQLTPFAMLAPLAPLAELPALADQDARGDGKIAVVTGGSGFVGAHLCQALVAAGYRVVDIDLRPPPMRLPSAALAEKFAWLESDVLQGSLYNVVGTAARHIDVVYHLAASPWGTPHPEEYIRTNVMGTLRALEMARDYKARFVLASSQIVYGAPHGSPQHEYDVLRPFSAYGYSKLLAERLVEHFRDIDGVDAVTLRFANIYGPGQETQRAIIPDIWGRLHGARNTEAPLRLDGTGRETRDFIYIWDAVKAYLAVAGVQRLPYRVYNVGTGVATPIHVLAWMVLETVAAPQPWNLVFSGALNANDAVEERPRALSWDRLGELGWKPTIGLKEGLALTAKAWKERGWTGR